jgi:[acyl-carrier-protein] S-malonyltransferase
MARDLCDALPVARDLLHQADEILGYKLSNLMFEGPDETLTETVNAQPAIFTASVIALRCMRVPADVAFSAGHSVGEYSALVAAGALSFEDGLRLVQKRGQIMQRAGTEIPGGMIAVLGVDDAAIDAACEEVKPLIVCAANYNAPGQTIISGEDRGLNAVEELLKARGARRVLRLNVSAAFHSPVMAKPARELLEAIEQVPVKAPVYPVIGNASAEPLTTEADIRAELAQQIAAPVRWEASVRRMLQSGVTRLVEVGPGKVLTGLNKRIEASASALAVGDLESIHAFAG